MNSPSSKAERTRSPEVLRHNSQRRIQSRKDRKGAVLLEFGIVFPIFLLFALGIMEFATLFFVRHAMLNAAREATRSYAIRESDAIGAEQLAAQRLAIINANFTITASPDDAVGVERSIAISVPFSQAALGDPLSILGDGNLRVEVVMRREED